MKTTTTFTANHNLSDICDAVKNSGYEWILGSDTSVQNYLEKNDLAYVDVNVIKLEDGRMQIDITTSDEEEAD